MRCPKCTSIEDKVIDSRITRDGNNTRRRRECLECGHRFTTTELLVRDSMVVIKRASRQEPFHRDKLLRAPLPGHDLYLAQQIDAAITSSLPEAEERAPSDPSFVAAAAKLFERLCSAQPAHGFFHWDASADDTGATPLFTRAGVMQG